MTTEKGSIAHAFSDSECGGVCPAPVDLCAVRLTGGLGNQLFQYATGRGVAIRNGVQLYLDSYTGFERDCYERTFALHHFDIAGRLLRKSTCEELWRSTKLSRAFRRKREALRLRWLNLNFDPAIYNLKVRGQMLLDGTWQSPRYFEDVACQIRKELILRTELSPRSRDLAEQIAHTDGSISIHIRRLHGYAVSGKRVGGPSFICGPDYYRNGLCIITQHVESPFAYVFTDEPFDLEGLRLPCPSLVIDHNRGERDYEDLFLMSKCRHHIIANSSFSWWGAWLNGQSNSIVCAPRNFTPHVGKPIRDVYPANWRVI